MATVGRRSIVTPALVRSVRALSAAGLGNRRIAERLGISRHTVKKALDAPTPADG